VPSYCPQLGFRTVQLGLFAPERRPDFSEFALDPPLFGLRACVLFLELDKSRIHLGEAGILRVLLRSENPITRPKQVFDTSKLFEGESEGRLLFGNDPGSLGKGDKSVFDLPCRTQRLSSASEKGLTKLAAPPYDAPCVERRLCPASWRFAKIG
jgi:hypothetical protein